MDQEKKEQIAEVSANLAEWQRKSVLIAMVLLLAGVVSMSVMLIPNDEATAAAEISNISETTAAANDTNI